MNEKNLYQKGEVNGDTVYYIDEECRMPFTGHVEYYFKDKLSWECDIVNGLREGLEKGYYDFTGELERIGEIQNNRAYGLSIEFYKSGRVRAIYTIIAEVIIDIYNYNEDGELESKEIMSKENAMGINYRAIEDRIPALRELYDLEQINEDIKSFEGTACEICKLFKR